MVVLCERDLPVTLPSLAYLILYLLLWFRWLYRFNAVALTLREIFLVRWEIMTKVDIPQPRLKHCLGM